jgi:hypothetical protein
VPHCLPVEDAHDFIIDQTLYWKVIESRDEAWFYVGMLNSAALTDAIRPFNPKGAFAPRHIHALPYRLMPHFDPSNDDHVRIAALARELAEIAQTIVAEDKVVDDPSRMLTNRRSKLRSKLAQTKQLREMELLCAAVLGISIIEDES